MGNTCGTDAYASIVGKYGSMFSQMVMAEQAKSSIAEFFNQGRNQNQALFQNYQTETFQQMDRGMGAFQNQFAGIEQALASQIPGGLQSVVPNGQSFQEAMGYSKIMSQMAGLRSNTESQITKQLTQATLEMDNMEAMTIAKVNESRPVIPQFDSLSPSLKKNLLQRAMEQYGPQIKGNNRSISDQISPILANSMAGYKNQLTGLNPLGQMGELMGNYQSGFGNQLKGLIPSNMMGGLDLGSLLGGFNLGSLGLGNLGNAAGMLGGVSNASGGIRNAMDGFTNNIGNGIGGMMNGITNGVNTGVSGVSNGFQNMGNIAQGGMNSFGNTLTNTTNRTSEGINRLF